jgi:hypothetical protein
MIATRSGHRGCFGTKSTANALRSLVKRARKEVAQHQKADDCHKHDAGKGRNAHANPTTVKGSPSCQRGLTACLRVAERRGLDHATA